MKNSEKIKRLRMYLREHGDRLPKIDGRPIVTAKAVEQLTATSIEDGIPVSVIHNSARYRGVKPVAAMGGVLFFDVQQIIEIFESPWKRGRKPLAQMQGGVS